MSLSVPVKLQAKINNIDAADTLYTLVAGDAYSIVNMQSEADNFVTIPHSSTVNFAIGAMVTISRGGAGVTTVTSAVNVTLQTPAAALAINDLYGSLGFIKIDTDTWREQAK